MGDTTRSCKSGTQTMEGNNRKIDDRLSSPNIEAVTVNHDNKAMFVLELKKI